jgi:hypothetical protein
MTYLLHMEHQIHACLYLLPAGLPGLQPDASASRKSWQLCGRETVLVRCQSLAWALLLICNHANVRWTRPLCSCQREMGYVLAVWLMQVPKRA